MGVEVGSGVGVAVGTAVGVGVVVGVDEVAGVVTAASEGAGPGVIAGMLWAGEPAGAEQAATSREIKTKPNPISPPAPR